MEFRVVHAGLFAIRDAYALWYTCGPEHHMRTLYDVQGINPKTKCEIREPYYVAPFFRYKMPLSFMNPVEGRIFHASVPAKRFKTAEHAYQHDKMRMAELSSVAKEILDPAIGGQKNGAQVKKIADDKVKSTNFYLLWNSGFRLAVARTLVWQKFHQQEEVRRFILDHIMYLFVEVSPHDEYFGCGRDLEELLCYFPSHYKYENVLGLVYTEVALHFKEHGLQEFVDEGGRLLTGEQLAQRRKIVWDRMQAAVVEYQAGRLHPAYFDLPGEPCYTRYLWDPQVGDATLPPGSGLIIPAARFQIGENWQHKPVEGTGYE